MVISGRERQPKECKIKVKNALIPHYEGFINRSSICNHSWVYSKIPTIYRGSSLHSEYQYYIGLSGPLHSLVTFAVDKCHNTYWTGCWLSPKVSLDVKAKRKILPLLGTKP